MKRIKKIISILMIAVTCLAASVSIQGSMPMFSYYTGTEGMTDASLTFSVLGDIHGNAVKFQEAIWELYRIRPEMDAMVLNGDIVDEGLENEYDALKKTIRRNSQLLPEIIIKNIGNHEFFDYRKEYNTAEDVEVFINRHLEFADEKLVYHDKWVKGYHFISLGSENGNTKEFNSVKAFISDKQLGWLSEKLAEGYEKGKPIFVFLHQHLSTSMRGWVGTDQSDEIKKILSRYPEVILFTSHTHASPEVDSVRLDQPFTMVHTGAVKYTIERDSNGGRNRVDDNYGLYVEVKGNEVTVKCRSFKRKTWIFSRDIK